MEQDEMKTIKSFNKQQDRAYMWRLVSSFAMMAAGIIIILVLMYIKGTNPS